MSNIHRILWIDLQVRNKKFPNCHTISEKFEISSRQAARDIEYMRASLGAPIEYHSSCHGYYYENETFILPAQYITEEEKQTLSYLAYRYEQQGSSNTKKLAALFERLTGNSTRTIGDNRVRIYDISQHGISVYEALRKAIANRRKTKITYCNAQNIENVRLYCPYLIFTKDRMDYVVGYCEFRADIRIFRLERIKNIELVNEEFQIVSYFDQTMYESNNSFMLRSPYQAILRISDATKLSDQGIKVNRLEDGTYRAEFSNSGKLLHKLMVLEEEYSILSPVWLKERLRLRLEQIYKNNFSRDFSCQNVIYKDIICKDIICPTPCDILELPHEKESSHEITKKGDSNMAKKVLNNIKMGSSWTTYISAAYGCMQAAGLWQEDICILMGMTGMAFHFIVHNQTCPSSVTLYDWTSEHSTMMERIGICSEVHEVFLDTRTEGYDALQREAVKQIRESIDDGIGVIIWAPTSILEFGIVYGYDDEDQIFYVEDCTGGQADPLLYTDTGKSEVPILFYQILKGKTSIDKVQAYKASLQYGVTMWNKEEHVSPDYGNGRKGYLNLIHAIEVNDYNVFGLSYIMEVYKDAKYCAAKYLSFLEAANCGFSGIGKAAELFEQLYDNYNKIVSRISLQKQEEQLTKSCIQELLILIKECLSTEEEAMSIIASVLEGV